MARARNIKPGFFLDDELAELDFATRILFAGLWTLADREGRLEDKPKKIKAQVLPYDNCDIDKMLNDLANSKGKFIIRYIVNGDSYIQITNFNKHQNPHIKEPKSIIPSPSEQEQQQHHTSTVQEQCKDGSSPADSLNLIPDSLNLIPDSLNPESDAEIETAATAPLENQLDSMVAIKAFEKEFGRALSPMEVERIFDWVDNFETELTLEALKRAVMQGNVNLAYIDGILRKWKAKNLRTIKEVLEHDKKVVKVNGKDKSRGDPEEEEDKYKDIYMS